MADRYWVGASGSQWNTTNTAVWSATSGGPSGASVPTAADSVFFDQAGTIDVVMIGALSCLNFNVTAGTLTFSNTGSLTVSGSMLISNVTPTWSGTSNITFNATTAQTVRSNGVVFQCGLTFNGVGGDWTLDGNLTAQDTVTLTNGAIKLGSNTFNLRGFSSNNSNARTINFGTGKFVITGTTGWTTSTITNLTIAGTPVIDITYSGATAVSVAIGNLAENSSISVNATAGTYPLTLTGSVRNVDFTGFSGSLTSGARSIFGNVLFSSGMTVNTSASTTTFAATSGIKTVTTNGKTLDFPVRFDGAGGSWQLQDALTLGSTRTLTLNNGTLDTNGKTVTSGSFASSTSNTRTLTITNSSIVILGSSWSMATSTNATINSSGSTINMNSASSKTFNGGSLTYGTLNQGGAGILTIAGSNTFANITNTVQPATVRLTDGTTQTVNAFSLSGTAGNLITLDTTIAGTRATLSKSSGTVSVSYVSIKDSNATGGATWEAYAANGNVDAGNNLGWLFAVPAPVTNTSVQYDLRSFTEKRRF